MTNQNYHKLDLVTKIAGESMEMNFTVEDEGSVFPIQSASLEWYLVEDRGVPSTDSVLDSTSVGVTMSLTTDGSDGRFDVVIEEDITDDLAGEMWQIIVVDVPSTDKQKYHGPLYIAVE